MYHLDAIVARNRAAQADHDRKELPSVTLAEIDDFVDMVADTRGRIALSATEELAYRMALQLRRMMEKG